MLLLHGTLDHHEEWRGSDSGEPSMLRVRGMVTTDWRVWYRQGECEVVSTRVWYGCVVKDCVYV